MRGKLLGVLLEVREVFEDSLVLRIFSDVAMTDFCVWIQTVDDEVVEKLMEEVAKAAVPVECLPWDLRRLERFVEQLDSDGETEDAEAVWSWGGDDAPAVRSGGAEVEIGNLAEKQGGLPDVAQEMRRVVAEKRPEVIISACAPVRDGQIDELEEFGIKPVQTSLIGSSSRESGCGLQAEAHSSSGSSGSSSSGYLSSSSSSSSSDESGYSSGESVGRVCRCRPFQL